MKMILKIILTVMLFSTISFSSGAKKYGKEITLKEKTKISNILKNPAEFEGKRVLVEGTVIGVCEKRGCWIKLAGDKDYESIRVKVNDGEIVFPLEAKGKKALVEGIVYSFVTKAKHVHKEGEKHENECENEGQQKKIYQIKGLGAVIK